ncbi:MAG: Glucose-6-phosphate 1-dehydrogenase, partial [uncultured bacterium]
MDNFSLVIVGITSNLAQIKLIPTLYDLVAGGYLPKDFQVIGIGRTTYNQGQFRDFVSKTLRTPNHHHTHVIDERIEQELFAHLTYLSVDLTDLSSYAKLKDLLVRQQTPNHVFYLATFPSLYGSIFENLKSTGLADEKAGWTRLLIEKPIGSDRDSARELNDLLTKYFREDQIFRLDHYLGKETLQNILTFRFGNGILEPLMTSDHIDHIEVTAAEDFGIGSRGSYYDQNGAIKDVGQNHLLQMLALATMDKPKSMDNDSITKERVKILKSLVPDPSSLVIGQYEGYLGEKDIAPGSTTETYFSFKTMIDNDR